MKKMSRTIKPREEPKIEFTVYLGKTKINVVDVSPKDPKEIEAQRMRISRVCTELLAGVEERHRMQALNEKNQTP